MLFAKQISPGKQVHLFLPQWSSQPSLTWGFWVILMPFIPPCLYRGVFCQSFNHDFCFESMLRPTLCYLQLGLLCLHGRWEGKHRFCHSVCQRRLFILLVKVNRQLTSCQGLNSGTRKPSWWKWSRQFFPKNMLIVHLITSFPCKPTYWGGSVGIQRTTKI